MTIYETVQDALGEYDDNEMMLDAFFQWAINPTTMTAGYGLEENYPYIRKNIEIRYWLSKDKAQGYVDALKTECDSIVEQTESMSDRRHHIGEIRRYISKYIAESESRQVLRHGVMQRLKKVSKDTSQALIVFKTIYELKDDPTVTPTTFTASSSPRNEQAEFQAYYKALYGETCQVGKVAKELVSAGVCNDMYWVTYQKSKSPSHEMRVIAILPTIDELADLGIQMPLKPDVPELLNSYGCSYSHLSPPFWLKIQTSP